MKIRAQAAGQFVVEMSRSEMVALNNALNEICNNVEHWEFSARVGTSREIAEGLLNQINQALS